MADLADKILQFDRSQEEDSTLKIAAGLNIPYVDIRKVELQYDILKIVPKEQIEALHCIPLSIDQNKLVIALIDSQSDTIKQGLVELEQMTGYKMSPVMMSKSSYDYGHKTYELLVRENEGERPVVISKDSQEQLEAVSEEMKANQDVLTATVSTELEAILAEATKNLASDIHFEPNDKAFEIRFRIDGVLHRVFTRPIKEYHGLSTRVKYLAKIPLEASLKPQDGRFTITVGNSPLDLRVASQPTIHGDMITIRLLHQEQVMRHLADLGLRPDLEEMIRVSYNKPHGMVLVSGPTGSGKTTTLYAILQELNTEERKIITIEDPVEYKIAGLEQSQVDVARGFGFIEGLRGALRQDPDVIMVGEIRDQETANIGIRAALTGHIVLATLHANNAPAAYSRLLEMGLAPFLFVGSQNIIIAQRLVRVLCPNCKTTYNPTDEEKAVLQQQLGRIPNTIYQSHGCDQCNNIGYRGRVGIFEAFVPSPAMEKLVFEKSPLTAFMDQALKEGMVTMFQDGLLKVEQGVTTLAEVFRVTQD